jgi:hypothetical protein
MEPKIGQEVKCLQCKTVGKIAPIELNGPVVPTPFYISPYGNVVCCARCYKSSLTKAIWDDVVPHNKG